ncbi:MAG: tetratricopeptide repeat protein [Acidobacteriaceae bacterium]
MFLLLAALALSQVASAQQRRAKKTESFAAVQSLVQQGRLHEAKTELLEELKQKPTSVDGYNLLGIINSEEGDDSAALVAFQKALQLAPNSTKTHNNLGNLYLAQKKVDQAEKEFRTTLRLDPGNRDGNYDLGLLLMARGKPLEAIPHFERVRPRDSATQLNLIRAYLQTKRTVEALRMAAALSAQNKNDVKLHFSLGVLLASDEQFKPAQLEFEKADVLKPGNFEILFSLGQAYMLDGAYPKAELEFTQALTHRPDSADALYLLGETYWKESRPLDALDKLVRAHTIAPRNTDIILLMAQISIAEGYFQDAIPLLQKGLQIAPQRIDLRSALGESYFKSDKIDKAIETFQQVTAAQPSPRAYAFLGLSHAYLGRFDQAKRDFDNGLKLEPGNTFCLFNLGYIAEQQGDSATAAAIFEKVLKADPNFPDALLGLASIHIQNHQFSEAEPLLRRYIHVGRNPATGYYKLAMVERELHQTADASRDLATFQTLSKNATPKSYAYEDLFDYLDHRSRLSAQARDQQDLSELLTQIKKHPDQPEILYLLAQAYLRSANVDQARSTIAQLDKVKAGDFRTLAGAGVLFARYHLYDDAIQQFQAALQANPDSDDVKFDLTNAYFHKGLYSQALDASQQVSEPGRNGDAYLALLADIYAHLGDTARAEQIYRNAITRSPDNDQNYLSLALLQFRQDEIVDAKKTLLIGQTRVPASGKILWGLGLASVMEGDTAMATTQFERAVDLLPEWPGSYSMLGVFYFQTGQIAKAKEVLERFRNSSARGGLNIDRIEQVLARMPATSPETNVPLSTQKREGLLRFALVLADRTL